MPHVPRNVPNRSSNGSFDGDVDAADVTYTPLDNSDWGDQDPGNTDDALDYLADLVDAMLPAASPNLSDMSASTGTAGNLSYGTSAVSNPAGYTLHPTIDIGGAFSTTSPNRGIVSGTSNVGGTLADAITADPNNAYPADSFGPGDDGTLNLVVNGSIIHSTDLSSFGSGDSLNGNSSGFTSLLAATSVQFPTGSLFDGKKYRSGGWLVRAADLRDGYNTVQVQHVTSLGTNSTEEYIYIVDSDITATTIAGLAWSGFSGTGSKNISGIEYHTAATGTFEVDISNIYRTTHSSSGSAISYPTIDNCSINSASLSIPTAYDNTLTNYQSTATATASRIINGLTTYDGFRARARALRTIQGTVTSSYLEGFNMLLDSVSDDATDLNDNMNGESYRIPSNADFDTDLSSTWSESISLVSITPGYSDGLQIVNSTVVYPTLNFSLATDGPGGNPDYSSASGERYWHRYFEDSTGASNFSLILEGSASVIAETDSFTGGSHTEVKISVKFPEGDGEGTGWLDITKAFVPGSWSDGDGCYAASFGSDITLPTAGWGISIGTRSSANAYDKMYVRVTTDANFTGDVSRFGVNWAVT